MKCLIYAHENGCPWDHEICQNAGVNGHFNCLKYAYENGCPWYEYKLNTSDQTYQKLIEYKNCLNYALANNIPYEQFIKNFVL